MRNLTRLFVDLFADKQISVNELLNFTDDHIPKLKKNNPGGIFNTLITDTETKYGIFDTANSKLAADIKEREGETEEVNEALTNFKREIRDAENLISYTFRKKKGVYQRFFPRGITEYTNVSMEEAKEKIQRFVDTLNDYKTDLPAAFIALFVSILTVFKKERGEQVSEKAEVSSGSEALAAAKKEMQLQLSNNILTIAANFVDQPAKAKVYFDQSLLIDRDNTPYELLSGSIDGNSIKQIEFDSDLVENNTLLTLRNESNNTTLEFYFAVNRGDQPGVQRRMVNPESEVVVQASEIGFDSNNRILLVRNLDAFASDYEVQSPE